MSNHHNPRRELQFALEQVQHAIIKHRFFCKDEPTDVVLSKLAHLEREIAEYRKSISYPVAERVQICQDNVE